LRLVEGGVDKLGDETHGAMGEYGRYLGGSAVCRKALDAGGVVCEEIPFIVGQICGSVYLCKYF
jgi:hypothetical protein